MPFVTHLNGLELPVKDKRGGISRMLPLAGLVKYRQKPNTETFRKYIARGHHNRSMTWDPEPISKIDVYGWDIETWKQFLVLFFEHRSEADIVYEPSVEDIVPPAYDIYEDLKYPIWVLDLLVEKGEFDPEIALNESKLQSTDRKVRSKAELAKMLEYLKLRKKQEGILSEETPDIEENNIDPQEQENVVQSVDDAAAGAAFLGDSGKDDFEEEVDEPLEFPEEADAGETQEVPVKKPKKRKPSKAK